MMNMNMNHQTPPLAPKPLCAVYAPLLPLLRADELDAEEAQSVRKHLADCAWCQAKLATHAIVGDAVRRHFGAGLAEASPTFTMETIMNASHQNAVIPETDSLNTQTDPSAPPASSLPPRRPARRLTALAALAAVVLLAILVGTLFAWQRTPAGPAAPRPTPIPTLDAQTQAYVAVLRLYYPPFVHAGDNEPESCGFLDAATTAAQKDALMQTCRPYEEAALRAAQTLLAHLQTTTAPPRWQGADAQLKQAAQGHIAFATERIRAIDAHDAARFVAAVDQWAIPADILFCSSLERITTDLKNAGISPVNLQELQPNDVAVCLGVPPAP
jgi:putative zinc finger protein